MTEEDDSVPRWPPAHPLGALSWAAVMGWAVFWGAFGRGPVWALGLSVIVCWGAFAAALAAATLARAWGYGRRGGAGTAAAALAAALARLRGEWDLASDLNPATVRLRYWRMLESPGGEVVAGAYALGAGLPLSDTGP